MQLMPATAKEVGVKDRLNPEQSLQGGKQYYTKMLEQFDGDEELALAAYNWGPGNINKALKRLKARGREQTWSNILKYLSAPDETVNYVNSVMRRSKQIARNAEGFWNSKLKG